MNDYTDDQLLALLSRSLDQADPVPHEVLEMAKAAPVLADLDAALALLVTDSSLELAGVRGEGSGRVLNFESDDIDVSVVVTELDGRPALDGQLVPGQEAQIELLRQSTVVRSTRSDALGRFRLDDLPTGERLRLSIRAVRVLTAEFEV